LVGLAALAVGIAVDEHRALFSYVFGFTFWFTLSMGALLALMIFHASGTRWIAPFRRVNELLALPAVLAAVFAIPLLAFLPQLYPWARPDWAQRSKEVIMTFRGFYLQPVFFILRTVAYLVSFTVLPLWLMRLSRRQDHSPGEHLQKKQRVVSAALLPVLLFTSTFACFDWLMSLTPDWWSELYAVYVLTGGFLTALALLIFVGRHVFERGLLPTATLWHFHSLGKLLLALVCFWAYIAYDQYMLIWIANLPTENTWYLARTGLGWMPVFLILCAVEFLIPFGVLLSRKVKLNLPAMSWLCGWLFMGHLLDTYWLIIPSSGVRTPAWTDVAALVGVGGCYLAFALWRFAVTPIVASGDPELAPQAAAAHP
jgi:hypothetical protein